MHLLPDLYRSAAGGLFLDKVDSFGLKLMETKTFDRGAVQLKYKPAPAKKTSKKRASKR
jgi:hypothetical protein